MKPAALGSFGARLKVLREAAGYTQEELATIAGLSVHGVSALERGQRRRPHVETVRALSAALDLTGAAKAALLGSARESTQALAVDDSAGTPLPVSLTTLLGRETDVQTLHAWLADDAVRLITLIGPGGVGKTRLALEVARDVAAGPGTTVAFVPLAAIRNPAFVAAQIAEALGLSDVTAPGLAARARTTCAGRPTLLVLDNFEQVLDAAPLVADLLASVATLRVLTTSRAPLHVRGEREYAVGPLALAEDVDERSPADLARSPAVRLFVERIRDAHPGFRLTPANGPTIAAICRRLDALPLALEVAAPWIKVLTPEDLLARLTDDVLLSTAGPRDLPERQQTINAAIAWSYHLLSPPEQKVFRRLGALPGRFSIEAATAVLAGRDGAAAEGREALEAAAGLIDRSLLLRADTSVSSRPRYHMLETVRAYAAHKLIEANEREGALDGLARYCAEEASLAADGLVGPAQAEWLDRVRDDLENYRAALAWLLDCRRTAEAAEIAWGLYFFWMIRGHAAEGLRWYQQVLERTPLPPAAESRALVGAAGMSYVQGDLASARLSLPRAMTLAEAAGEMEVAAQAENLIGHLEHSVGNMIEARKRFIRCVEAFRELAVPWGVASALGGLASVALKAGDVAQGERLLDEAAASLRHTGPWFLMPVLYVRAILAVRQGNADRAIALLRENLAGIRELHDKFAFVFALVPLAAAAVLKGDDAWGARILGVRDAVIERTGVTVSDAPVRDLRERAERDARARLGPDRWARAYAAGRTSAIESAHDLYRFVAEGHR